MANITRSLLQPHTHTVNRFAKSNSYDPRRTPTTPPSTERPSKPKEQQAQRIEEAIIFGRNGNPLRANPYQRPQGHGTARCTSFTNETATNRNKNELLKPPGVLPRCAPGVVQFHTKAHQKHAYC